MNLKQSKIEQIIEEELNKIIVEEKAEKEKSLKEKQKADSLRFKEIVKEELLKVLEDKKSLFVS
tara:strand:- start:1027 stop:1218 length:192 start_codon:yes stop_codon:yes gene_type:complete